MEPRTEELHTSDSSLQPSAAQLLAPEEACSGRGSEREEKAPEGKGPEPQSTGEKSTESEAGGGNSCSDQSESGSSSDEDEDSGWKRQRSRGNHRPHTTGSPSDDACGGENVDAHRPEDPDSGHSGCRDEPNRDSCSQRAQRRPRSPGPQRTPPHKRRRSGSPGPRRGPPHMRAPLRRGLVMVLRCLSQAVCEDVVQVQRQQLHSPLSWEHLAQLRAPLSGLVQTLYSMASQAAYAFPSEAWMVAQFPGAELPSSSPKSEGAPGPHQAEAGLDAGSH